MNVKRADWFIDRVKDIKSRDDNKDENRDMLDFYKIIKDLTFFDRFNDSNIRLKGAEHVLNLKIDDSIFYPELLKHMFYSEVQKQDFKMPYLSIELKPAKNKDCFNKSYTIYKFLVIELNIDVKDVTILDKIRSVDNGE